MNASLDATLTPDLDSWYREMVERYNQTPVHQAFGLHLTAVTNDGVELLLDSPPEFRNAFGSIHGGVLATALDSALLQAVRVHTPGLFHQSTLEIKINFLRPASEPTARVEASALHVGRRTGVARATAFTSNGKPIVAAQGTIHIERESEATR
jgi:acyl-CoA thioesterase